MISFDVNTNLIQSKIQKNMKSYLLPCILILFLQANLSGQKVLQIEKFGKAKTEKLYVGASIFIQTKDNPDWFEGVIDDLLTDAQAVVFYDRIIPIDDITAVKFRKKSTMNGVGRALQWSWVVPTGYQAVFDLVEPVSSEERKQAWKATAFLSGATFLVGSLMRFIPPKKLKFGEGERRRLRVLDLTFYAKDELSLQGN